MAGDEDVHVVGRGAVDDLRECGRAPAGQDVEEGGGVDLGERGSRSGHPGRCPGHPPGTPRCRDAGCGDSEGRSPWATTMMWSAAHRCVAGAGTGPARRPGGGSCPSRWRSPPGGPTDPASAVTGWYVCSVVGSKSAGVAGLWRQAGIRHPSLHRTAPQILDGMEHTTLDPPVGVGADQEVGVGGGVVGQRSGRPVDVRAAARWR